ncbi:futalosine hydrolase [Bacillus horti]|uniref:Futalosine hydrolase n=1 Tax=Caldalkalibacillus horti TaxID=77523 RepID=A0ABT9VYC4_9BACI|nr:futalosine hydrolase [Bacillus horti]MDQ0165972.1 futalosine hydrolase [Bacillus horti]
MTIGEEMNHRTRLHSYLNRSNESSSNVLIMTAVQAEKEAILRGIQHDPKFEVQLTGVGPVAAATATAKALSKKDYSLVINAGIAGGFPGQAQVESIVLATEIVSGDLGAETPTGFSSLDELGFGTNKLQVDHELMIRISEVLQLAELPVHIGPIVTVSTVTGSAQATEEMANRVPGVVAEGMEGYGVAYAAHENEVPVIEIRSISNLVGPRNRDAWRIKEALGQLEQACSSLVGVLT